ncbi:hypothetical protein E0H56_29850 [Rhizobium leguminosarum bv. viciae]|nr:hypothetical protein E0H61_17200 [Rhizobium leguminosarum bv. viciae]TBZ85138.1 hypothetical protein E0H56_29850 [Rhizobium leguminosarum bv. viciae]
MRISFSVSPVISLSPVFLRPVFPEHDAEKCAPFSATMLHFFGLDQDSDFRPIGPKIILI